MCVINPRLENGKIKKISQIKISFDAGYSKIWFIFENYDGFPPEHLIFLFHRYYSAETSEFLSSFQLRMDSLSMLLGRTDAQ